MMCTVMPNATCMTPDTCRIRGCQEKPLSRERKTEIREAFNWLRGELSNPLTQKNAAIVLDEFAKLQHPLHVIESELRAEYELPHKHAWRSIITYLQVCVERRDWHGVSDAANDLREMEAAYPVLKGAKL